MKTVMRGMRLFRKSPLRHRQELVELADAMLELDDHTLTDIGLDRQDVVGAAITDGAMLGRLHVRT